MKDHLTVPELIARWRDRFGLDIKTGTLANWRSKGLGPDFKKFGRAVIYPVAAVEAYEQQALAANDNADPGDEHQERKQA